jgi:hypothetical protein
MFMAASPSSAGLLSAGLPISTLLTAHIHPRPVDIHAISAQGSTH